MPQFAPVDSNLNYIATPILNTNFMANLFRVQTLRGTLHILNESAPIRVIIRITPCLARRLLKHLIRLRTTCMALLLSSTRW